LASTFGLAPLDEPYKPQSTLLSVTHRLTVLAPPVPEMLIVAPEVEPVVTVQAAWAATAVAT
jgi:hypothetical protein